MYYLPHGYLSGFSLASPCCFHLVQSQLDRRISYYLSTRTPSRLTMMLSDPTMMQRCEALALSRSLDPLKQEFLEDQTHPPRDFAPPHNFISLKVSPTESLDRLSSDTIGLPEDITNIASRASYSKVIQLDDLDFLYQMCFAIYECKSNSSIAVSNLCGGRVKFIRLWSEWFTGSKSNTSSGKLFTKLVWCDSVFDVGFIVSAYGPITPGNESPGFASEVRVGSTSNSRFYRIEVEQMVIRDRHILGLFEGLHT